MQKTLQPHQGAGRDAYKARLRMAGDKHSLRTFKRGVIRFQINPAVERFTPSSPILRENADGG